MAVTDIIYPFQAQQNLFDTTSDETAIVKSNMLSLLLTLKGERIYYPTFGCDVKKILFESSMTDDYSDIFSKIQDTIIDSVEEWMSYVNVSKNDIKMVSTSTDITNNIIRVEINFTYRINDFITSAPQTIQLVI